MERFVIGLTIAASTALWTFVGWKVLVSMGVGGKTIMLTLVTVVALNMMINAFQYRHWLALAGVIGWIVCVFVVGYRRRAPSMME